MVKIVFGRFHCHCSTFHIADLGGGTSNEVLGGMIPSAHIVKAFTTLTPPVVGTDPRPRRGRRNIYVGK